MNDSVRYLRSLDQAEADIEHTLRTILCPNCSTVVGQPCKFGKHSWSLHSHSARYVAALKAGLAIPPFPGGYIPPPPAQRG